jgi:hypothetical protein
MRRVVTILTLTLITSLLLVGPASAAKPTIVRGESFEAVIPFPGACGDFGLVATVSGKTHYITFADGSGVSGGQFFMTWSRDDDPSVARTFAISGPTFYDITGAIDHGTGSWTVPLEDRTWVIVHGKLTLSDVVVDGFQALEDYVGTSVSVCDLLA